MKLLLTIVLTAAALYAGYWVVASRGLDRGLEAAITAAETQGWQIESTGLTTGGFPSRFDVTARDLTVTSPDGNLVWQTPWVETAALSYQPNKVIAVLAPAQTLRIGDQSFAIASEGLRANVAVAASPALDFTSMTAEAQNISVQTPGGAGLSAGKSIIALRALTPQINTYEAYLSLDNLVPAAAIAGLPAGPARLTADATAVLDRPLDRHAIMPQRPLVTSVSLSSLNLTWGDVQLTGRGSVDVDAAGLPTGEVTLTAKGWEAAIDILIAGGIIAPQSAGTIRTVAGLLVADGALTIPLTFADGRMALGPIPLGPAPLIRLP